MESFLGDKESRIWGGVANVWAGERAKEIYVKSAMPVSYLIAKKQILEEMRDIIDELIVDEMHKYPDQ